MLGLIWTVIANVLSINEHNNNDSKTRLLFRTALEVQLSKLRSFENHFLIKLQGKLPRIVVDDDNSSQKMS
jgi:hypothetical protein